MSSENKEVLPSDRSFGLLFAAVFALLSAYAAYQGAVTFRVYGWLFAAILMGLMAVAAPSSLRPLNKAWMKLGGWMGAIVSPLVLAVIFFVIITPVALISRIFGRDELRLKRPSAASYWIDRTPPGPVDDSFKNQF